MLLALAGCGFRPLYGTHAAQNSDKGVTPELADIYIQPIADRQGQLLRNALLVRLNPDGEPAHARFRLEVAISSTESQVALQKDETASRAQVEFTANYRLLDGDTKLTEGSMSNLYSYDYLPQQYSNVTARSDINKRAAEDIAEEIRNRMAAYFIRAARARAAAEAGGAATGTPQ